jgi:metal-responsive CopG/Arc/MetJ family transcriptional regulator
LRKSVTISLPAEISERLDDVTRDEGASRSDVVRAALTRYLDLRELRRVRELLRAEAAAKGILTDEDISRLVS